MKKKITFNLDETSIEIIEAVLDSSSEETTISEAFEYAIDKYHEQFLNEQPKNIYHGKISKRYTIYIDEEINIKLNTLLINHNLNSKNLINNALKIVYTNLYPSSTVNCC